MKTGVLLEHGLVVDGSGGPAWPGDVLLVGDRIAALGEGLRARLPDGLAVDDLEVVDCRGKDIEAVVVKTPFYKRATTSVTEKGKATT